MILERHTKSALLLFTIVMLFMSCDSDNETYVTGALLYRNTGNLAQYTIISDSIEISNRYMFKIGAKSTSISGTYDNVSAVSLYKFRKPDQSIIDNLESASITFSIIDAWNDGSLDFALYNTTTGWEDSTEIDPDLFSNPGDPISTYDASAENDSLITKLRFEVGVEDIDSWEEYGAVLLKNTDTGLGMVTMSSDNSSSSPALELIRNLSGIMDTTTVRSREGTYFIESDPAFDPEKNYVGDGYATGFVIDINLADFNPAPTSIHKCTLNFTVSESLIHGASMAIVIQLITSEFTTIEDVTTDYGSSIDVDIIPGKTSYSVDISRFIESWHNFDTIDHGILFRPFFTNNSPNYIVIEPPDSLVIEYTTLPEVE